MSDSLYRDPRWLRGQIRDVLSFYYPTCLDLRYGGYVIGLDERDGHVYDARTKHLVASARAVHNFSVGALLDGPVWCRTAAEWGLDFLSRHHWDGSRGGYDWVLDGRETVDDRRFCYGQAFVLLAAARAHQVGIEGARAELGRAFDVIDDHFWEPDYGLCADHASGDWSDLAPYRGQNANMHTCEALIAAYEATDENRFLDRAYEIADTFTRDVTRQTDGLLWEHYTEEWEADLDYNRDQPRHQFRPWGYEPGHHLEWAKLLAVLDDHHPETWFHDRAVELFEAAVDLGWDDEHGGFYYTTDGDGDPVVADKFGWVHTEGIGAAALLATHDGDTTVAGDSFAEWYDRLWAYADAHLINPRHRNWFDRLTRDHERDDPNRGVAVEPGYHPLTNAWLAMRAFERS
jgi:mannose/cellobiose epimerase-like protein (N-acyl-D-glucosamine 2-epimerase family)